MGLVNTFSEINLVSNAPTLQITPRRRIYATQHGPAAGPDSIQFVIVQAVLQDVLRQDDGLQFDLMFGSVDNGGSAVPFEFPPPFQIIASSLNLRSNFFTILELATPVFTTLTITGIAMPLVPPPIPYLQMNDLEAIFRLRNPGMSLFAPNAQPMNVQLTVAYGNSSPTNPIESNVSIGALYRVVHGLQEG